MLWLWVLVLLAAPVAGEFVVEPEVVDLGVVYPGLFFNESLVVGYGGNHSFFNASFGCVPVNGSFEGCMLGWCGWKVGDGFLSPNSINWSMNGSGVVTHVFECFVPYHLVGDTFSGFLEVTSCSVNCSVAVVNMSARKTEGVYFTTYTHNILKQPILFSFTGECVNSLCINIPDAKPVEVFGYLWTGFRTYQVIFPILLTVFIITLLSAVEQPQHNILWILILSTLTLLIITLMILTILW